MMGLSGGVSSVQLHDACVLRALALYHAAYLIVFS
jgi:hypothetical protein